MDKDFDRYTVQFKHGKWAIYGWGVYEAGSVLEGQAMKCWLEAYDTEEEAQAACPNALHSHDWLEPQISLAHLPDENDPVAGGMYPDDY